MYIIFLLFQIHWLYSPDYQVLQRNNDDWFIVFTSKPLGKLNNIHIWHDSYGSSPMWYCKRIDVLCVRDNITWTFNVNRWFSILRSIDDIKDFATIGKHPGWFTEYKDLVIMVLSTEYFCSFR